MIRTVPHLFVNLLLNSLAMAVEPEPVAAEPEVLYVDAREGEPFSMESLCMQCLQNVSGMHQQ